MGDQSYYESVWDEDDIGGSWNEDKVRCVWPSIKLIFQSPAKKGSPGGLL